MEPEEPQIFEEAKEIKNVQEFKTIKIMSSFFNLDLEDIQMKNILSNSIVDTSKINNF